MAQPDEAAHSEGGRQHIRDGVREPFVEWSRRIDELLSESLRLEAAA